MSESKPILAAVVIQSIYAGNFLLTKLAINVGMNTFVFVFYRQAFATLFLAPIAFFFERKTAPQLSFSTFIKIFFLSLFGITMSLNVVGVGLKYTAASLGAAISNSLPVITFFLAVLLRMEKVNIRSSSGMMKMTGVTLCIGGIASTALYRGPLFHLRVLHFHSHSHSHSHSNIPPTPTNTWINGVFLLLLSNITWACWLVFQGKVLKSYPSKLLLTTLQCFLSTIQSFIAAVAFTRDPSHWKLGWNIPLLSVAYCGIAVTGVSFYMQSWVIEKKGPVFLAMTMPLIMLITLIISAFFGETIALGSVLGALFLVGGLYFVLWGKSKEEHRAKTAACLPNFDEENLKGDSEKTCEETKPELNV